MTEIATLTAAAIGALGALFGAGLTQFASYKFRKQDREWERQKGNSALRLERGEELYVLLIRWSQAAISASLSYSNVMKGVTDYNSAFDSVIQNDRSSEINFDRISLIFDVHFHELLPQWEQCKSLMYETSRIEADFRRKYKMGVTESPEHLKSYCYANLEAEKAVKKLNAELAESLRLQPSFG